jgi:hypothetical protein
VFAGRRATLRRGARGELAENCTGAVFRVSCAGISALLAAPDRGYQKSGWKIGWRSSHQSPRPGLTRGPSARSLPPGRARGQTPGSDPGGLGSVGVHDLLGVVPEAAKAWMPGSSPSSPREGISSARAARSIGYANLFRNRNRTAGAVASEELQRLISNLIKQAEQEGRAALRTKRGVRTIDPVHPPRGDAATNAGGLLQIRCRCSKTYYRCSSQGCGIAGLSGGRRRLAKPPAHAAIPATST